MSGELLSLLKEGELANSGILDHLTQLIRSSVETKSDLKGLNNLEIFSYYLQRNKFQFREYLKEKQLAFLSKLDKQYLPYLKSFEQLSSKVSKIDDHRSRLIYDILQEYQALKTAGISIGESNAYHLKDVLKVMAIEHQTKSIRFWGKILGYKDYWIIQGSSEKAYLEDLPVNGEKYGSGVNTYSYWAATNILDTWIQLPLVTPQQVSASKSFKYVFTGNPEQLIKKGSFEGRQKQLLKCIVARITHSCELAPKGLYKTNEENPSLIQYEEEFKLPQVAELNSLEAWVHLNPNILEQGRCSYFIDPSLNEEQKETLAAQLAEKDPIIQRLKSISEDKPFEALGFSTNWTSSIFGQLVPVNQIGKLQGTTLVYGVACLKNMVWPGAVTIGYKGGWTNIYVGYGDRISQPYLQIRQIKQIKIEGEDIPMKPQPNPSKVPVIEQKKEEEVIQGQQ